MSDVIKKRDSSIDLLRILAMLGVVVLHVARTSGALSLDVATCLEGKLSSNICESFTIYSVNIFALVTGYLCALSKTNYSRYLELYFSTVFYYVGILCVVWVCIGARTVGVDVMKNLIPTKLPYWYVVSYTVLFFLMPFLNKLVLALSKRELLVCSCSLILFLSVLPGFESQNLASHGHNVMWLVTMYLCGAYVKLYPPTISIRVLLPLYMACTTCLFVSLQFFHVENVYFRYYTSPFVSLGAISFFIMMCRLELKSTLIVSVLSRLSPLAFGVYLIHCHPYVWKLLEAKLRIIGEYCDYSWWFIPAISVLIYLFCSFVDALRSLLFSVLKVRRCSDFIISRLRSVLPW